MPPSRCLATLEFKMNVRMNVKAVRIAVMAAALAPRACWACACGCGVFDVGTSSMLPQGPGGMIFAEYDYMDQNMNWHASSPAPAANSGDKAIRTHFIPL